jgi:hypothetical protein
VVDLGVEAGSEDGEMMDSRFIQKQFGISKCSLNVECDSYHLQLRGLGAKSLPASHPVSSPSSPSSPHISRWASPESKVPAPSLPEPEVQPLSLCGNRWKARTHAGSPEQQRTAAGDTDIKPLQMGGKAGGCEEGRGHVTLRAASQAARSRWGPKNHGHGTAKQGKGTSC